MKRRLKYKDRPGSINQDETPKVRERVTVHRVKDKPMCQSVESFAGVNQESNYLDLEKPQWLTRINKMEQRHEQKGGKRPKLHVTAETVQLGQERVLKNKPEEPQAQHTRPPPLIEQNPSKEGGKQLKTQVAPQPISQSC